MDIADTSVKEQNGEQILQRNADKLLLLCLIKAVRTAGFPFTGTFLKVAGMYAGKLARTVLRGRKLPGGVILMNQIT